MHSAPLHSGERADIPPPVWQPSCVEDLNRILLEAFKKNRLSEAAPLGPGWHQEVLARLDESGEGSIAFVFTRKGDRPLCALWIGPDWELRLASLNLVLSAAQQIQTLPANVSISLGRSNTPDGFFPGTASGRQFDVHYGNRAIRELQSGAVQMGGAASAGHVFLADVESLNGSEVYVIPLRNGSVL